MKKVLLVLTVGLLFLTACSSNNVMSGYKDLKSNNHYTTKKYTEIMDDMENKVPGVYYIGFPDCPWCKVLVPELETILAEHDLTALAIDTRNKEFENNETLQKRFKTFLTTFQAGQENESGSVPFITVISNDGIVGGHVGLAPSYDDPNRPLTDDERQFFVSRIEYLLEGLE